MRASVTACVLGALGALVGGWLVARWCLGVVLIAESGCGVWYGLQRDDGTGAVPVAQQVPLTLAQVFERARGAP
jgi:hypothetical protein